jgi:hypothetical protein
MTNTPAREGLPELPASYGEHCVTDSVRTMREPGYTAAQMQAYAVAYAAALAGQPAMVSAAEVFRIAGGDTECCPNPTAAEALACLSDLRECYDEALSQPAQGGGEVVEKYEALMRIVCDFLDSLPAHYCPPNKKYSHHVKEMKAHIAADSKPYEVRHEHR